MIEHIVPVESGINHAAVVTKKVKDCMDGMIDDIDVEVISEYLLFNSGLKQSPGHAVITDFTGLCKLLKDFLVVFFKIVKKSRTHSLHLIHSHLNDPEERLNGVIRLLD